MAMKIYTREQIQEVDQHFLDAGGDINDLFQQVGQGLAKAIITLRPNPLRLPIYILVGPGKNGIDGLHLGSELAKQGYKVDFIIPNSFEIETEILTKLNITKANVLTTLPNQGPAVVIDSLFGIGLTRPLSQELTDMIAAANLLTQSLRIAIDLPTGIDCDTGELLTPKPFMADLTLAVSAYKTGQFLLPGSEFCGDVHRVQIGKLQPHFEQLKTPPNQIYQELEGSVQLLKKLQPKCDSHKYTRGLVQIIQDESFPGAALIAAKAAQVGGAGYVRVWCPEQILTENQANHPELVFTSYNSLSEISPHILDPKNPTCWLLGSGWSELKHEVRNWLHSPHSFVFDGGCLQNEFYNWLIESKRSSDVLTPHQGELQRLVGPFTNIMDGTRRFTLSQHGTLVAKGYNTLICQAGNPTQMTTWNSPRLSFAGSGDVLAGLIASFKAQGLTSMESSQLAVELHRMAGSKIAGSTPKKLIDQIETILIKTQ